MNRLAKSAAKAALGATLVSAALLAATPASAQISFGFGVGPRYYGPPPRAVCDPYSRWYDPYRCNAYYGYDPYYEPGPAFRFGYWDHRGYWHRR